MNLLTKDLSKVDTSYPVLKKGGPLRFVVSEMKVDKTKDGKKDMLITVFKSKFPWPGTRENEQIGPGYSSTDRIVLTPSEGQGGRPGRTDEAIMKDLKKLRIAILGEEAGSVGQFMPLDQYLQKEVDCMIDIEEDTSGEFGPQNRLRKMEPAKR